MKNIFVVILNYNGFEDTRKCLETIHILRDKSYRLTTVIVDNGSGTEELKNLKTLIKIKYPGIILLENGKNLGFARGNNVGIRFALAKGADFVFILNNDTLMEMNFLRNLVRMAHPISSPVVRFREFADKPKMMYDLGGFVNWWTGRTYHLNAYDEDLAKYSKEKFLVVDYVAGCSMLVRKDVFERIGLLDEKYFIYFEDVDFCVTAQKNGFQVIVDREGYIYHKLGGSMDRWSNRAIYRNLTGNFIFITKHLGWRRLTGYVYLWVLTAKIIRDRILNHFSIAKTDKNWKGSKHLQ